MEFDTLIQRATGPVSCGARRPPDMTFRARRTSRRPDGWSKLVGPCQPSRPAACSAGGVQLQPGRPKAETPVSLAGDGAAEHGAAESTSPLPPVRPFTRLL